MTQSTASITLPKAIEVRPVDAAISRSWLLVNGARPESFAEAVSSAADQVILDIEDAVDPGSKCAARATVADRLETNSAWVRVNDRSTGFWSHDLDGLRGRPGLAGVVLAKTESPDQVSETVDRLGGTTPVIALIESALGIEEAPAIARARGVFRLAFGSGDYRRDTGASSDDLAMAYPRSRLVVASRIGGLPGPIDGPTVSSSHPVLRENTATTVSLGLTGKLCLHPDHTAVVNEAISPTRSDINWAQRFLADFDARNQIVRDGSDLPRLARAQKIVTLATAFSR